MDNKELKIKYDEVLKKIDSYKKENKDISDLLKIKYELLKIGYARIRRDTMDSNFDKNPKKYSTLLSYLNTMKEVSKEINMSQNEVQALENEVKNEMKKNGLGWLLTN